MHIEALVIFINVLHLRAKQDDLVGCFQDYKGDKRVLQGKNNDLDPNGSDECKEFCEGYRFYGTESGEECFCGNEMKSTKKTHPCTEKCEGNPGEYCGGHWKIMIYDNWHCVSEPCKNGAICADLNASKYACYCTESWEGDNCEIEKQKSLSSSSTQYMNFSTSNTSYWISTSTMTITTTHYLNTNMTTNAQSRTITAKLSTDDKRNPVILIYVLLPLVAGVLVVTSVVVVIYKRRPLFRKDSKSEMTNKVTYSTPYSTAYSVRENDDDESESRNNSGQPFVSENRSIAASSENNVYEIELDDYNVTNHRPDYKIVNEESYDHVNQYTASFQDYNSTTYNKLKICQPAFGDRNCSKNADGYLYDKTDIQLTVNDATEYSDHIDTREGMNIIAGAVDIDTGDENTYYNEEEFR